MKDAMIKYRCSKCEKVIGIREIGTGISFAKFSSRAMPIGKGSGLYQEWVCRDCDKDNVDYYIARNRLCLRPWMIGGVSIKGEKA